MLKPIPCHNVLDSKLSSYMKNKNILKILTEKKGGKDFKYVYCSTAIFPNATKLPIKNY